MVSAPPLIAWKYNRVPADGSPEDEMLRVLKQPREWAPQSAAAAAAMAAAGSS